MENFKKGDILISKDKIPYLICFEDYTNEKKIYIKANFTLGACITLNHVSNNFIRNRRYFGNSLAKDRFKIASKTEIRSVIKRCNTELKLDHFTKKELLIKKSDYE